MPLIKSTNKEAFQKNIGKEISAGKPPAQAAAIAYSEKREAAKHHSKHSEKRSAKYHSETIEPVTVRKSESKMTRGENKPTDNSGEE